MAPATRLELILTVSETVVLTITPYGFMAPPTGFEPIPKESKSFVLPLHYGGIKSIFVRNGNLMVEDVRFERLPITPNDVCYLYTTSSMLSVRWTKTIRPISTPPVVSERWQAFKNPCYYGPHPSSSMTGINVLNLRALAATLN